MLEAQYRLSKEEGLFVEASCASSVASLLKEGRNGRYAGKKVVCVLTGGGLKDPTTILKIAIKPPTIYPEVENFLSLYEGEFFEGKTVSFTEKDEVVFDKAPSEKEIEQALLKYFETVWDKQSISRIKTIVESFLIKGKAVTFSDLQDVAQDVLEAPKADGEKTLSVRDFQVITGKDKKPQATVQISISGQDLEGKGEGTGPVDALINALRVAGGDKMNFSLTDYKVDIRNQGTDAVVFAQLKLSQDGNISLGTGTSPDIIQASLEAFVEAYNGFK